MKKYRFPQDMLFSPPLYPPDNIKILRAYGLWSKVKKTAKVFVALHKGASTLPFTPLPPAPSVVPSIMSLGLSEPVPVFASETGEPDWLGLVQATANIIAMVSLCVS
jgi:hypothetical protein